MRYKIEFELPDNDTVRKEIKHASVSWGIWGYSGTAKAVPSIDAIPVIRCAECKWFQCNVRMDGYLPKGVDEFECRHWCGSCDPVDFCSYGERKEE